MKMINKKEMREIDVVEIVIDTLEDYEEYLGYNNDEDEVLFWLGERCNLDCTGNHNTWFGSANSCGAKFDIISDCDGSQWVLHVIIADELTKKAS
jgi:hypothetical protein